jgi:hypothetical protein
METNSDDLRSRGSELKAQKGYQEPIGVVSYSCCKATKAKY